MTAPMERIQTLDSIEKDVILCLQSAGKKGNFNYVDLLRLSHIKQFS